MKNLNFGLLFLLAASVFSASCNKEEAIPAYEIINNELQGTWQHFEVLLNDEDSSHLIIPDVKFTFTKSATDARRGTIEYSNVIDSATVPYVLSEDGKILDINEELEYTVSIEGDVLTMTGIKIDEDGMEVVIIEKARRQ